MKQGWKVKKLSEVCRIQLGKTPYRKNPKFWDVNKKSGNVWLSIADLKHGETIIDSKEQISNLGAEGLVKIPKGTMLLSFKLTLGRVSFSGRELYTNEAIAAILNLDSCINIKYLYYYFSFIDWNKLAEGDIKVKGKTLNKKKLSDLNIYYPPLPEQERIVAILDECFAAIDKAKENAEQNLRNAKELFESYLNGIFERKGENWEEKNLEEMVDEKCSLSYGIVQPGEEFPNGLPVIRPTDLTSRYIRLNGLKRINPKLAEGYKRTKLIGDELLLCVRGTTGVVSIATPELKNANVTRGIVPIRFNSKFLNQEYGYYIIISKYIQEQIRNKTYGAALMQINIGDLRKIKLPYPDYNVQKQIVHKLYKLELETRNFESVYQNKIENLAKVKISILRKAFSGELNTEKEVQV